METRTCFRLEVLLLAAATFSGCTCLAREPGLCEVRVVEVTVPADQERPVTQTHSASVRTTHRTETQSMRAHTVRAQPVGRSDVGHGREAPRPDYTAAGMLRRMEDLYRAFQYAEVLGMCESLVSRETASVRQRACAFVLAGASAHVLGDDEAALTYMRLAVQADPSVSPEPKVFTRAICELHQKAREP